MKKSWMLLLAVMLLILAMAVPAMAATEPTSGCIINGNTATVYTSLSNALSNASAGDLITLYSDQTAAATVNKEIWLDLNGHSVTGTVTITSAGKLYLIDSANNAYTDEGAVIKNITFGSGATESGNIVRAFTTKTLQTEGLYDGNHRFLVVKTDAGYSAHRIYLAIKSTVLVPNYTVTGNTSPAIQYRSVLRCDATVAGLIGNYGLAPVFNGITADYPHSLTAITAFDSTDSEGTENSVVTGMTNTLSAASVIDGTADDRGEYQSNCRAYIILNDQFGTDADKRITSASSSTKTLKQLVEAAYEATTLANIQKNALGKMYDRWGTAMTNWGWTISDTYTTKVEKCLCGSSTTTHKNGCDGTKLAWYEWDLDQRKYLPNEPGNWYLTSDTTNSYFQVSSNSMVWDWYYDETDKVAVRVYRCTNDYGGDVYTESMIYATTGDSAVPTALTDDDLIGTIDLKIDLNGLKIQGSNSSRVFSGLNHSSGDFGTAETQTTDPETNEEQTVQEPVKREYYRLSDMDLTICDTSANKTGTLAAYGTFNNKDYSTSGVPQGCVVWITMAGDTVAMHNITVNASNVRMGYGAAMATNAKTDLYGCTFIGGTAQGYTRRSTSTSTKNPETTLYVYAISGADIGGGAIWINTKGDVTMHGGSISGGTTIYRYMSGSNGVLIDRAVGGGNVYISSGGKLTVDGTVTPASITGGRSLIYGDENPIPSTRYGVGGGVYVSSGAEFTVKGNVTITGNTAGTANGTLISSSDANSNYIKKGYTASNTSASNVYLAGTAMTVQNLTGTVGVTLNGYEGVLANADANYVSSGRLVADEAAGQNAMGILADGVLRLRSSNITEYSVGYGSASIHPTDSDIRNGLVLSGHGNQSYSTAGEYVRITRYWNNDDPAAEGMEPTPAYDTVVGTWEELMATCIAITDTDGDTVLLIEVDACSVSTSNANTVKAMVSLYTGVPQDNITVSASHQHSTPAISTVYWTDASGNYTQAVDMTQFDGGTYTYADTIYSGAILDVNEARQIRTNYAATFYAGVVNAAVAAMNDRAAATIQYGIMDTTSEGNQYNFVRNIAYYQNGVLMGMNAVHHKSYSSSSGWTETYETEMDTTMQLVLFDRSGSGENNIIMANFQTHPHMAGGAENLNINADMVGRFRQVLKAATGADVLYFSGAGGNVNTTPTISADNSLLPYSGQIDTTKDEWEQKQQRASIYGNSLAQLAYNFMKTAGNMTELTAAGGFTGDVKVSVQAFQYDIWDEETYLNNKYGEGTYARLIARAKLMINWSDGARLMTPAKYNGSTKYDFDGDGTVDGTHWQYFVNVKNISEKDGDEIFSYYHASGIYDRWKRKYVTREMTGSFDITAYDLGGIGFIAAPYEMFQENGQQIKGNVSAVTGKTDYTQESHFYDLGFTVEENPYPITIIASYANGGNGYIPSAVGFVNGGYSTDTTKFDYGTGEKLAKQYVEMLRELYEYDLGYIEKDEPANPNDGDA